MFAHILVNKVVFSPPELPLPAPAPAKATSSFSPAPLTSFSTSAPRTNFPETWIWPLDLKTAKWVYYHVIQIYAS